MKTEAVKNEVLNFISLQPLFHYGVPPLSIRADNLLRVAVINNSLHNIKTYSWECIIFIKHKPA